MPNKIQLSTEFLQQVKQLFEQEDYGTKKIAKLLDVPRNRVENAFKQLGIITTGRNNPRKAFKATEKICKTCQITKPVAEFRQRINAKTDRVSFESSCAECEKQYYQKRYQDSKEKHCDCLPLTKEGK